MNTNSTNATDGIQANNRTDLEAHATSSVSGNCCEGSSQISDEKRSAEPAELAPSDFETMLEREARIFSSRSKACDDNPQRPIRIIVADFEFSWDCDRHNGYRVAEGEGAEQAVRWPFHRIVAACWLVMKFDPTADEPIVEELRVVAHDEADECEIVKQFFGVLDQFPDACLVSWGGETKDLAVLRRCAAEFNLLLPCQLRDLSPHSKARLDLCRAVAVQARPVHLPEYCAATSVPCKPSPSKTIGKLVQAGAWSAVREQVLADVLTTSVICLRHLTSHGLIVCHPQRSLAAVAEAAAKAMPASQFLKNSFAPWGRGQLAASRLKGTIIRAA